MKKKIFLNELVLYVLSPLAIFYLFKNWITSVLNKTIIDPILSTVSPSHWTYDIVIISVCLSILFLSIYKINRGVKFPAKWCYIIITFFIIYLHYRFFSNAYNYTSFSFFQNIKLLDVVSFLPIILICISPFFKIKEDIQKDFANGFAIDEATAVIKDDDILARAKFINEVAKQIKATNAINGSFPIGIVASWGDGKTTFLKTLAEQFDSKEFVVLNINVWKYSNASQLIEFFFKSLQDSLGKYSFTINTKLKRYTNTLLKNVDSNILKTISEIVFKNDGPEKQYDEINDEIKKIKKKIIIFIDDLDRLDKQEIYEVIRLIRNTASFSNTFFVVAYDRNYILNAIEEINPYQANTFLEKIFQLEFTLPPISRTTLQSELQKRLEPILSQEAKDRYNELRQHDMSHHYLGIGDLSILFINNMRDVIRFINSFKLTYEFVKDEVYFPDFYNLELIRFKHPELFLKFYKDRGRFISSEKEPNFPDSNYHYTLKRNSTQGGKQKKDLCALTVYLNSNKQVYKLNDDDIEKIGIAFSSLFPSPQDLLLTLRLIGNYSHLSVLRPSMFDRYFFLGIEGRLSHIKFSIMRNLPINELQCMLYELSRNEQVLSDITEYFLAITDFNNREDFENIVQAIVYFANLSHPKPDPLKVQKFIGYKDKSLAQLIGNKENLKYYEGVEQYNKFILSVLKTRTTDYNYSSKFLNSLLKDNYYLINHFFDDKKISQTLLSNFKYSIKKSTVCDINLIWLYYDCIERSLYTSSNNINTISYPVMKEASILMRYFVCKKDLDGFLLLSISKHISNNNFVINTMSRTIFRNERLFIWLLNRYKRGSKYKKEFLNVYELLRSDKKYMSEGVPLSMFKTIPVSNKK